MGSTRNQLRHAAPDGVVHPATRFVTDFTRLITAVDRLMMDIGIATEKEGNAIKTNGDARPLTLNGTISTLREHAHSFVKSLRHFELLFDRIPVPFMELDEKARILRTNEECADMLDGSATPLAGKSLFSFVSGSDTRRLREFLAVARETSKPCVLHLSLARRGRYCPVELRLRRQLFGNDVGYVAVIDDADELRKVNSATGPKRKGDPRSMHELIVNLSRAQTLRSMADTVGNYCNQAFGSPAGIIFVERDGNLQMVSQWRSTHIPKKYLAEDIIKKGPAARAFRTGAPVFCRRESTPHSTVGRQLDGLLRRCHSQRVTFLPISGLEQRPVGVLAIVLPHAGEFTEPVYEDVVRLGQILSGFILRARAHDEALAARARAESIIQSKDDFISTLSHELRNPMMPILSWAVALSSGTLPADKHNLALEGIVRNVRALNYLIEDLFDAARIASGKLRLELAEIRIQDVAREALTAVQHTVESKKLRISTDISEAIPPFMADSRRLHQVLMNLLNNAVKFTPGGGSIALQVRRRDDSVECIVSDTGKGIERKFLPFVFERFRQDTHSSKVHAAGLGLGLAIVREIVELHGGTIEALSQGTDKGSTFILRLPMHRKHGRRGPRPHVANASDPDRSEKRLQNIRSNSDTPRSV